ncbi:MAG: putative bacteriophage portal protein [Candidatus Eremiobacteraeota bacterium]|nr:putative bacteriophage portal protein [Candidatus Eremiobacteraeota bacterium]
MPTIAERLRAFFNPDAIKEAPRGPYASAGGVRVWNSNTLRSRATVTMLRNFANNEVVRTAIDKRKHQISSSRWQIVRLDDPKAPPNPAVVDAVTRLLRYVNPAGDSMRSLLEKTVEDHLVLDAGCIEIEKTLGGGPAPATGCAIAALWAVDGALVEIDPNWEKPVNRGGLGCDPKAIRYRQVDRATRRVEAELLDSQLVYMMGGETTHRILGWSPVETLVAIIEAELYGEQYDFELLKHGIPPGWIDFGGMTNDQLLANRSYYESEIEGTGRTAIFGGGSPDRKPIVAGKFGFSPSELERKFTKEWLVKKIAMVFSLDPTIFGITSDVNKASSTVVSERTDEGYVELATLVAEKITRKIVWQIDENHGLVFPDLSVIDPLAQAQIDKIYITSAVILPNEMRAIRFGMDPYEGGDVPIRPAGAPPDPADPADPSNADDSSGKKAVDAAIMREDMARMRYLASPTPTRLAEWVTADHDVEVAKSAVPFDVAAPAPTPQPRLSSSSSSTR